MKRALYYEWLKALETAPKTKGCLKDEKGMCCLGVLCDIHPSVKWDGETARFKDTTSSMILPLAMTMELDLDDYESKKLAHLNDKSDTFAPVIEYLKANEGKLFPIED
jgi:hypothetical protein